MSEPDRIEAHAHVINHVAAGRAQLTEQLRNKPVVAALLTTWLSQVQELEDALWALYALTIDNSSGHALDQIGEILLAPRPAGLSDVSYRRLLKGAALTITSSGTGDELSRILAVMLGDVGFELGERFPAALLVTPAEAQAIPTSALLSVFRRARSAGVSLQFIDVPDETRFRFSSAAEESVHDSASGFGDESGADDGGALIGVLT